MTMFMEIEGIALAAKQRSQNNPKYIIKTYGCQMNEHDSEVLAGILEKLGYSSTDEVEDADIVLVNTCCVRDSAETRILGELGRLKQYKDQNPGMVIGVCGCMPMQQGSKERIRRRASHLDFVFGTGNLHRLPHLLQQAKKTNKTIWETEAEEDILPSSLPRSRVEGTSAWVPIIYGCDNYCTYCTVPHVRGRERSRPPREIRREIEQLASEGVRQVTLLGQNVNSYGKDLDEHPDTDFASLLTTINEVQGLRWINYTTSHPRDFASALVDTIKKLEKVAEHFHIPVQSGSDRLLKRMNRGYTKKEYLQLVNYIKEQIPDASLTTDVIVGFPGETEEDFQQTMDLFERVRFDGAFSFMYSPRPGTVAADYENHVSEEVKKERLHRLNQLQNDISLEINQELVGEKLTGLVEGPSKKNLEIMQARTKTNKLILFEGTEDLTGHFVPLEIVEAQSFQLRGRLLDDQSRKGSH